MHRKNIRTNAAVLPCQLALPARTASSHCRLAKAAASYPQIKSTQSPITTPNANETTRMSSWQPSIWHLTALTLSLTLAARSAACQEAPGVTPAAQATPIAQAPPVKITVDAAGNLVLQSDDPGALDRLEEMMQAIRPPSRPYDIFKVKYARASWIKLNLDDYFEDNQDRQQNGFGFFFFGLDDRRDQEKTRQLGDKPPLRFIADNDTNSIVVQGADDIARQTIRELIKLWDVPEPETDDTDRYTRLVRVRFSRADAIANTIKEAYRDLLSANDKTFQASDEEKRGGNGGGVQAGGGMSFAFKGRLSLGVDSVTNSILVSAEGKPLLDLVCGMVEELDQSAQPQGNLEVYHLPIDVNGKSVRDALMALLATPKQQQQNEQQPQQNEAAEGGRKPDGQPRNQSPNRAARSRDR
jgi:type II secretory pathway component GspD/PulD (secretin)